MLTPLAKQKPIREVLSNITFTTELKALAGCKLVVENITENVEKFSENLILHVASMQAAMFGCGVNAVESG